MTWWQWVIFAIGILTIGTILFMIVYLWIVTVNRKEESDYKKNDQIMTMTIWRRTVDTMPPVGVSVQTIDIRDNQEIRYLEKVGDHVMVWKAYDDDIGIPVGEVKVWAKKVTKGDFEE